MHERGTAFIITFFVYNPSDGQPATGAASALTAYISKDGGTPAAATNSVFEVSGSVQPGIYGLQLTAAETDGNTLNISFISSDIGVAVMPVIVTTEPHTPTAAENAAAVDVAGALSTYGAAKPADVSGALSTYGAAKKSDVPTAAENAAAVDVSGALSTYGAAKKTDVPTAAENAAAVDVPGALSTYGAAKKTDVPTAAQNAAAVDVAGALSTYGAAKPADVADALTSYGAAKPADIPTAAENAAAVLQADVSTAEGDAAALSLASLILAQFNSSIDTDGRWTIYNTDGTVKTTRQVASSSTAEPIIGIEGVEDVE